MYNLENAVQYHYGKFPPNRDLNFELIAKPLVKAVDVLARYDQMLKNMHNSEILLAPLSNQEAVISSRMEGTISTMDAILKYEADHEEHMTESSRSKSDVLEIILYRESLKSAQRAIEQGHPISQALIRSIHQQLLSLGRGSLKEPGKFKTEQNYVADKYKRTILFVPISPDMLQDGLDRLFEYINDSKHLELIKTAIAHIEFEALHPFTDGNGRIGRMLITLMLWATNAISAPHFYISAYLEEHRDEYIDTMRYVSESGDWESWCVFFLEAIEQQSIRNLAIAESIDELYETMKQRFADTLSSKWSVKALDFVFANPVFRNSKFTHKAGIPRPTAARFSRVLLQENIIQTLEESSGRRAALFSFEPLMKLVRV